MEDQNELFEQALDIEWPWYVDRVAPDPVKRLMIIHLDFVAGGTFTCGTCGVGGCKAYDTRVKKWRHLDFFGYRTFLQGPSPRVDCATCGVRQAELTWARRRQGFTLRFEEMVLSLAREMSVRTVARVVGEHDTRLGRIVSHYAEVGNSA